MSERLLAAVRAGDKATVRAIVEQDPDLASRNGALHAAVLARAPALVRILMAHGANARVGVYPHRDATSPFTIAMERGYDDVVAVIREQEDRHRHSVARETGATDALFEALQSGNDERVRALVTAEPALHARDIRAWAWRPCMSRRTRARSRSWHGCSTTAPTSPTRRGA